MTFPAMMSFSDISAGFSEKSAVVWFVEDELQRTKTVFEIESHI